MNGLREVTVDEVLTLTNRQKVLTALRNRMKALEHDLKRYSSEKLTTEEYTAVVEIREACNRIIEDEMCRG